MALKSFFIRITVLGMLIIAVYSQGEFQCYDCNSGSGGWVHEGCPKNGDINDKFIATSSCDERCFTRTNKWTPGVIHRGCSSKYYLPRPGLPESGCVQDPLENWWCFCTGDKCNTDDMSAYV